MRKFGPWHWIRDIYFINSSIGFAVGDYGTFLKTTNGGSTWNYSQLDELHYNKSVFFTSATHGIVLSTYGRILKTEDGGTSWNYIPSGTWADLNDVHFPDDTTGYIAGGMGVLKTTDGGDTWEQLQSTLNYYLNSVCFITKDIGYCSGSGGTVIYTEDGGLNWTRIFTGTNRNLVTICFPEVHVGYATGENGTILAYKDIFAIQPEIPVKSTLSLFPNPVSDFLEIKLSEPFKNGQLSILDINGKELMSQSIDQSSIKVNLETLSSGIYFARIIIDQDAQGVKFIKY